MLQPQTDQKPTNTSYSVYDGPARSWTHPCNCTLVAHEKCLLEWIQSAQGESPERARNALKCPQCGTKYEIESKKSLLLNVLDAIDRILQRAGSVFTVVSVVGIIGVMGSGTLLTDQKGMRLMIIVLPRYIHHVDCLRCMGCATICWQRVKLLLRFFPGRMHTLTRICQDV